MNTFRNLFDFLYTTEDEKLFDFLYVYDDPVKQTNVRNTKRFQNPKFKFVFFNNDNAETVDWSRGGAWLKGQTRQYSPTMQIPAMVYTDQNKLVGPLKVEIIQDLGSKGIKVKYINPDNTVQSFFDKTIKEQNKRG